MRTYRLIILLILTACKATVPTGTSSTSKYSEDLSVHRPELTIETSLTPKDQEVITEEYVPLTGHIKEELDSIARVAYEENKKGKLVDGYIIQVYSGSSREEANAERSRMLEFFPDLSPKVSYHQPTFRVKAGRFTERLKAHKIYEQVKKEFPRALLIPERFLLRYE